MTKVINIKSGEKYDIYCGRAGHGQDGYFGNPHKIGGFCLLCYKKHDRESSIEAFKQDFEVRISKDGEYRSRILLLKDKTLGCFCKPLSCHCDVIKEYLDESNINNNRVIIAGSRTINNYKIVENLINQTIKLYNLIIDEVICGEARGVDTCGKQYAINNNIQVKSFPADWDKFGKSAGWIRNEKMAKNATHLILIWDGISKGSKNMFNIAEHYGLKIYEYIYKQ